MTHNESPISCRAVVVVMGYGEGGFVTKRLGAESEARMLVDALCDDVSMEAFDDLIPMEGVAVITVEMLKDRSCEIDVFGDGSARAAADRMITMIKLAAYENGLRE